MFLKYCLILSIFDACFNVTLFISDSVNLRKSVSSFRLNVSMVYWSCLSFHRITYKFLDFFVFFFYIINFSFNLYYLLLSTKCGFGLSSFSKFFICTMSFLYNYNKHKHAEKKIMDTLLFTITSKKIKFVRVNLTKKVKDH